MDFGGLFRERRFYESPLAIRGYKALRAAAEKVGFQVVLKTFYSPIPDLAGLPPGWWERVAELPGLDLDLDRQLAWVRERLAGPMAEFDPPAHPVADPFAYTTANPSYSRLDAATLYATVRALKPARIVELGSGHSTLVTAEAVRRNAQDGAPCRFEVYDPYPSVASEALPGLSALRRTGAQELPAALFEALGEGDVLFVDTTHTVKTGSDVNFVVLEVLPRLAPGVVVHVHDIFLPFEYPSGFAESFGLYWTEQYLLQAFLAMNPGYEILLANAALGGLRGAELGAALAPGTAPTGGSAFWIRRTPAG
jgi:predicted O-methyltransferase YrrM